MKFMKLGSKADTFVSDGTFLRYAVSELPTDVTVNVGDVGFRLHKFPLLSKSGRLQSLITKASEDGTNQIFLHDFPGGPKAFELCAKFCYGMTLTLNAYNILAVRCAAEYLEMTEVVERGNLILKIEVFLNSSVFRSWKDTIVVLQSTQSLKWSEEPKVVVRCIDCIASKISVDPKLVNWSYTYRKRVTTSSEIVEASRTMRSVPKDWWIEDICELDVGLYKRVMMAVKSKGRTSSDLIGEALKAYAVRWLPDTYDNLVADDYTKRYRILVESIVYLLPSKCSCKFLLKLLKVVILVGAGDELKEELVNRISLQLHKASAKDLLIPEKSVNGTAYDVPLVQSLVRKFFVRVEGSRDANSTGKGENEFLGASLVNEIPLQVGRLIDEYLAEIATDPNLPISSFIDLSMLIPDSARCSHDGLYSAIDIYLKEHPTVTKTERKRICSLINVQKLSSDASIQAAQNDLLPLRVIVQLLFFKLQRLSARNSSLSNGNAGEDCGRIVSEHQDSLSKHEESLIVIDENNSKSYKEKGDILLQPSRSRKFIDKLWFVKGHGELYKSSGTSGSTPSSPATIKPEARVLASPSTKNRRYSVS